MAEGRQSTGMVGGKTAELAPPTLATSTQPASAFH